jgi:hypothetical protein
MDKKIHNTYKKGYMTQNQHEKRLGHCPKCKTETQPVRKKEFNKLLDACLKTPPLRLKDLKEQLRKERERKRGSK